MVTIYSLDPFFEHSVSLSYRSNNNNNNTSTNDNHNNTSTNDNNNYSIPYYYYGYTYFSNYHSPYRKEVESMELIENAYNIQRMFL